MDKIIVTSMRENAGKTSLIIGMSRALQQNIGYFKPLGDRLFYRKKLLWDYDSALMTAIFGLSEEPTDMSLGFDHAKLRFMYDQAGIRAKLLEGMQRIDPDKKAGRGAAVNRLVRGSSPFRGAIFKIKASPWLTDRGFLLFWGPL